MPSASIMLVMPLPFIMLVMPSASIMLVMPLPFIIDVMSVVSGMWSPFGVPIIVVMFRGAVELGSAFASDAPTPSPMVSAVALMAPMIIVRLMVESPPLVASHDGVGVWRRCGGRVHIARFRSTMRAMRPVAR